MAKPRDGGDIMESIDLGMIWRILSDDVMDRCPSHFHGGPGWSGRQNGRFSDQAKRLILCGSSSWRRSFSIWTRTAAVSPGCSASWSWTHFHWDTPFHISVVLKCIANDKSCFSKGNQWAACMRLRHGPSILAHQGELMRWFPEPASQSSESMAVGSCWRGQHDYAELQR